MAYRLGSHSTVAIAAAMLTGSLSIAHAQSPGNTTPVASTPVAGTPTVQPTTQTTTAPPATPPSTTPAPTSGTGTSIPPSGTSIPPAVPSSAEASQIQSSAAYNVRLRDLERKVNELKEQVFRSKARLNLLKETVLHGVIAGARSAIVYQNKMSGMYVPVHYSFALDGTEIFSKTDESGKLGDQKEFEIYNGSITPGNHTLSVQLVYQGNAYGTFAYMKGYKFTAHSSHTFTATEGKQLQVKVVGFEKGNAVTTDPKDRPAVDFKESVADDAKAGEPTKPAGK
jgi:hypothetical protein